MKSDMNEREALRPMRDGPAPEGVGGRLVRGLRRLLRRLRRRRRQRAAYRRWIAARDRGVEEAVEPEGRGADTTFSVLVPWTEGRWEAWIRSLTSVRRQRHPHWELCIAADARTLERLGRDRRWPADGDGRCRLITVPHGSDPAAAANSALETCSGRFVIHLPATGRLAPRALSSFAAAVRERPDVRMLYADEDRIDWRGRRRDPSFKCEFNHTLLLTHDCLSHPLACARDLAVAIGGWRAETGAAMHHDFALRCVEQVERRQIVHVPEVLHHRRADFATMAEAAAAGPAGRAAVAGHLALVLQDGRPHVTVVDPARAACLFESARAGHLVKVPETEPTIMAMLECYEPSLIAFRILERVADGFMTVEEDAATEVMRRLAHPSDEDPAIVSGESGGAGLAGLITVLREPALAGRIGLGPQARVLVINTEGATDPDLYKKIVGHSPDVVLEGVAA